MLERGLLRRVWAFCAAGLAAFGIYFVGELAVGQQDRDRARLPRRLAHLAGRDARRSRRCEPALRCGPVAVPDHKLRPDVMSLLNVPPQRVIDRNEARH